MRLLLVGLLPLAGCLSWGPPDAPASETGLLMSTSNAFMELDSAAMSDDGEKFFAIIDERTWCSFVADDGYMELDATTEEPVVVQDIHAYTPLVATRNGLAYVNAEGNTRPFWNVTGVGHARFRDDGTGAVAHTTDGYLWWFDGEEVEGVDEIGACSALDLDRSGDTAWLACEDGVVRATPAGVKRFALDEGASRVAWSEAAARVVVVGADARSLTALDADGAVLWTRTAEGRVLDIAGISGRGLYAALIEGAEGTEVVLLTGADGEVVDRLSTDGTGLRAAHDAARIVVLGGYTTGVYDVE